MNILYCYLNISLFNIRVLFYYQIKLTEKERDIEVILLKQLHTCFYVIIINIIIATVYYNSVENTLKYRILKIIRILLCAANLTLFYLKNKIALKVFTTGLIFSQKSSASYITHFFFLVSDLAFSGQLPKTFYPFRIKPLFEVILVSANLRILFFFFLIHMPVQFTGLGVLLRCR